MAEKNLQRCRPLPGSGEQAGRAPPHRPCQQQADSDSTHSQPGRNTAISPHISPPHRFSSRYLGRDLARCAPEERGFCCEKAILEVFIPAAVPAAHAAADGHRSHAEARGRARGGLGGPATIGEPRSGSRTSSEPALTSSPRRRLSATAPSAHPPEPAELFNRQPCRVTLPSPPPLASLRSGAGAAWKGQSCQFAPALGTRLRSPPAVWSPGARAALPLPFLRSPCAALLLPLAKLLTPLHAGAEALGTDPPAPPLLPTTHRHGRLASRSVPAGASRRAASRPLSEGSVPRLDRATKRWWGRGEAGEDAGSDPPSGIGSPQS